MNTSIPRTENETAVVFETLTLNLAVTVCSELEAAGFPACLRKINQGFGVFLPKKYAPQGRNLLQGQPRKMEIFC